MWKAKTVGMRRSKMFMLALLPVALGQKVSEIPDGPRGGGAVFSSCGGIFSSSDDLCYEVVVSKLTVQMGPDGTNEDVMAKICADDKKTCCETPVLSSALSDDWSSNDLETWTKKYFGNCIDKKFKIKNGLELTLSKKGVDTLGVTSLFIDATTIGEGKTKPIEIERFDCGKYNIGGKADAANSTSSQSQFCRTSPYEYERVQVVNVTVGPDGTDDNVKIEICSDVNTVCCKAKISSLLSDDWKKNNIEVWKESNLGDCKNMQYKVNKAVDGGLRFTLSKDGKDDLSVNNIIINTVGAYGDQYKYECGEFKLESQGQPCVPGVNCSQSKVSLIPFFPK
ncbi:uncharacterized protein LOC111706054 [Eurytemora carolleeae]|uniref:uncharacterized protein LOC111706054 n=1 Tax=Eurytemora carolleeae TaxID=1294199 RepID=UPI000C768EC7|nr:uncharacterized protein LOC111706054 [Eurytemora carolleeae]|eukprot:XP_023334575.1 uncharacterized protein LOC111706054 [Eurytemora affinis]